MRAKAGTLRYRNAKAVKKYKEREIELLINYLIWNPDVWSRGY